MVINEIEAFLKEQFQPTFSYNIINGGASDRRNFEVCAENKKYILTQGNNTNENISFITFANFFQKKGLNVPIILAVNKSKQIYLQEHLGEFSLLDILAKEREGEKISEKARDLYKRSIDQLLLMQMKGKKEINKEWCYDFCEFNSPTILHDLFYFKNYFLDLLGVLYSKKKLIEDFYILANRLESSLPITFIHRDFQARNIIIKDNKPFLIDFQGGMFGPPVYDLISLIWQSRANLPGEFREELKTYYFNQFNDLSIDKFNEEIFEEQYQLCLIIRQLQTLGAYGFRGVYEKKPEFVQSISQAIINLKEIKDIQTMKSFLYLGEVLQKIENISETKINQLIHAK